MDAEIRELIRNGEHEKAARMATRMLAQASAAPATREAWLERLMERLRPAFAAAGAPIPEKVRVSVGFPSRRALSRTNRVIGECWSRAVSEDGVPHVFVSPVLEEKDAGHVFVHELVHAAVGCEHGHKGEFVRVARALGLAGKPTATTAGPELAVQLATLVAEIGPYPHMPINAVELTKKKQGTRLIKLECPCGRILRAARTTIEAGPINCGVCNGAFEAPEADGEEVTGEVELAAANGGGK
jgi:hypothetical protein